MDQIEVPDWAKKKQHLRKSEVGHVLTNKDKDGSDNKFRMVMKFPSPERKRRRKARRVEIKFERSKTRSMFLIVEGFIQSGLLVPSQPRGFSPTREVFLSPIRTTISLPILMLGVLPVVETCLIVSSKPRILTQNGPQIPLSPFLLQVLEGNVLNIGTFTCANCSCVMDFVPFLCLGQLSISPEKSIKPR